MNFLKEYFHFIDIPPLLPVTIAFIVGIIYSSMEYSYIVIACTAIPLISLCLIFNKNAWINIGLHTFFYSIIALSGNYLYKNNIDNYNAFYQFTLNKSVDVTGTVIDKNATSTNYNKSTIITLAIDQVNNGSEIIKTNKTIVFYGSEKLESLSIGDTVTFFNIYCKKPDNESFLQYQIKEQIAATVFDRNFTFLIIDHPSWSFRRWIYDQNNRLLLSFKQKLSFNGFLFFSSLFLGNRACVKESIEKVNEQFKRWGIYHLLSRSGMHLALFIFTWQAMLRFIPMPFIIKQLMLIILSLIYCLLSWTSAPFIRSLALLLFNKGCIITHKSYHSLHYLLLTCLCFLIYSPLYLFFLDFQLSFGITFALIWYNQLYSQCLYSALKY